MEFGPIPLPPQTLEKLACSQSLRVACSTGGNRIDLESLVK